MLYIHRKQNITYTFNFWKNISILFLFHSVLMLESLPLFCVYFLNFILAFTFINYQPFGNPCSHLFYCRISNNKLCYVSALSSLLLSLFLYLSACSQFRCRKFIIYLHFQLISCFLFIFFLLVYLDSYLSRVQMCVCECIFLFYSHFKHCTLSLIRYISLGICNFSLMFIVLVLFIFFFHFICVFVFF